MRRSKPCRNMSPTGLARGAPDRFHLTGFVFGATAEPVIRWERMVETPKFTHDSSRTVGGDPVEGADPGGARSTKPGQRDKTAPRDQEAKAEHTVTGGDRNPRRESRTGIPSKE